MIVCITNQGMSHEQAAAESAAELYEFMQDKCLRRDQVTVVATSAYDPEHHEAPHEHALIVMYDQSVTGATVQIPHTPPSQWTWRTLDLGSPQDIHILAVYWNMQKEIVQFIGTEVFGIFEDNRLRFVASSNAVNHHTVSALAALLAQSGI